MVAGANAGQRRHKVPPLPKTRLKGASRTHVAEIAAACLHVRALRCPSTPAPMEFLNQTYIALRGPTGAPQSASDTIARLSDRLNPSTLLADRRAAVLSLKGLARDCKDEVAERALPGLLEVLQNDAEVDADIGRAVLETLNILCEVNEDAPAHAKELSFKHTDQVLATDAATHKLFALLADHSFYLRLAVLQYLVTLLQNRRQVVQGYFLKAPVGPTTVISTLEEKREIIRTGVHAILVAIAYTKVLRTSDLLEALTMLQLLLSQSPDIQKILAFEGAFEKLFAIVTQEGGIEGGVTVRDALACVDTLLRYNPSNQVAIADILPVARAQLVCRATSAKPLFHPFFPPSSCFRQHCHPTNPLLRTSRFNSGIPRRSVSMLVMSSELWVSW